MFDADKLPLFGEANARPVEAAAVYTLTQIATREAFSGLVHVVGYDFATMDRLARHIARSTKCEPVDLNDHSPSIVAMMEETWTSPPRWRRNLLEGLAKQAALNRGVVVTHCLLSNAVARDTGYIPEDHLLAPNIVWFVSEDGKIKLAKSPSYAHGPAA